MRKLFASSIVLVSIALPAAAVAADCGTAPQSEWMSEADISAKGVELGYDVRSVKVEEGCYEIYGIAKDGAKVEVLLNPVSAEVVSVKSAG